MAVEKTGARSLDMEFIDRLAKFTVEEVSGSETQEIWAYDDSCDLDVQTNGGCSNSCSGECAVKAYAESVRAQLPKSGQVPDVYIGQNKGDLGRGIYGFNVGYFLRRNRMPDSC